MSRTITVKGTGSVSAKPDLIAISLVHEVRNPDYGQTMRRAAGELGELRARLEAVGFGKDRLKTADFNVSTEFENYQDNQKNWRKKFVGYRCVHRLNLEFDLDMELLGETLSAIAACPAKPVFEIKFSVKNKSAVSDALLESAVANAAAKARILAKAADVALGPIAHIDYSWGELRLYSDTKYGADAAPMDCSAMKFDIEPENIDVQDHVTVVWEIG